MTSVTRTILPSTATPAHETVISRQPCAADRQLQINVVMVKPTWQGMTLQQYADAVIAGTAPVMTHDEYATAFAIPGAQLDAIAAFGAEQGLSEISRNADAGYVKLSGTIADLGAAFGVTLEDVTTATRTYRSHAEDISLPSDVADLVLHVLGLDDYVPLVKHLRLHDAGAAAPQALHYVTPAQAAIAYQFPAGNGLGAHIGIIEVGGGYDTADVVATFSYNGAAVPTLVDISVSGGINYGSGGSASDETLLDLICCGGVAPGAILYMYFAPDTFDLTSGLTYIYDAVNAAITDVVNNPSVVSVSYGFGQSYWDAIPGLVSSFEASFQAGVAKGISVLVASGDDGAQGRADAAPSTGYPGSSPYCISCGGTTLQLNLNGSIASETVWNQGNAGTGGGISTFALPSYQLGLGLTATPYTLSGGAGSPVTLTKRGMPDLSSNSDPASGYRLSIGGVIYQYGGTSAAAPLLAGLCGIINANTGSRVGFINSKIYTASSAFTDVTVGNNCASSLQSTGWAATAGWDACTGMGSPIGTALQALFASTRPSTGAVWPQVAVGVRPSTGQAWPRQQLLA